MNKETLYNLYLNKGLSIEALCEHFKLGKKKIKAKLDEFDIQRKVKGGQTKYNLLQVDLTKYDNRQLRCKISGKVFRDIANKSGSITDHIKQLYPSIVIPSSFKRRMYLNSTGKYWHEEFFDVEEIIPQTIRKCRYCDWQTIDIENKTGCYEVHLKDAHQKSIKEFLAEFPEEEKYHLAFVKKIKFIEEKHEDSVTCKICGCKVKIINNKHLKKHGMTVEEYKLQFPTAKLVSKSSSKKLSDNQIYNNIHSTNLYSSKGELEVKEFLRSFNLVVEKNRKILNGTEIDMLIEVQKLGIEFNGLFFHGERNGKTFNSHLKKMVDLNEKGYNLIQIFEDEWETNKDLLKAKLKHIVGLSGGERVGARKCKILEITSEEKSEFLGKYHVQGNDNSSVKIGGFFGKHLIAVMTFDNNRNMNGQKSNDRLYELKRYATDYNYICQGLASKMVSYFIKNYSPEKIISFADRRWTFNPYNNMYTKMGFALTKIMKPNYTYYNSKISRYKRFHKFQFGKKTLIKKYNADPSKTEKEIMIGLGYDRIWDCGLFKYEMIL